VPYIYELSFEIPHESMRELDMGHSLQRVLGYLKINLPGERGHVLSSAWYSVDDPSITRIVFYSEWAHWEDLLLHKDSALFEDKVLEEFGPHITDEMLTRRFYAEVGTEPQ